ncbi:MAG: S8 family serine peptidase [Pseudomonadales bacterium]|nr:S8 family serine peptidase [Pseudomonadales bacterium]
MQDDTLIAQYLWDEENRSTQEGEQLAQYLWDEENRGSGVWEEQVLASAVVDMKRLLSGPFRQDYIVLGEDPGAVKEAVREVGALVTDEFNSLDGVGARLTRIQLARLSQIPGVRGAFQDRGVKTATLTDMSGSGSRRDSYYPTLLDADLLHRQGITGTGVGVAVIDSGAWHHNSLVRGTDGKDRLLAYYDAINDSTSPAMEDPNGHGSHIASVLASSQPAVDEDGNQTGSYQGIAPDADLVVVKAFDDTGRATYMDVIRGIDYVIAHKDEYNIKVLNLSFNGTPISHYWQDPLNMAVMAAWEAGITVVVSAGNRGPDPMSIGVPANVPYVVSVGAMSDN